MARPNYFHLLGITNYSIEETAEINKAILLKQAQWSRDRNNPSKAKEAKANLDIMNDIKKVMLDPETRQEEAEQARTIDDEKKINEAREKFEALDTMLDIISKKGWVDVAEIQKMSKELKLSEDEIKSRVSLPIEARTRTQEKVKRQTVDTNEARRIASDCQMLAIPAAHNSGIHSLYDFLQISPTSSIQELIRAAEKKYDDIRDMKISLKKDTENDLIGRSKATFRDETKRKQYDTALSQLRLEKMKEYLKIATATNVLQLAVIEHLQKIAISLGDLSKTEARAYIEQYCEDNKVEISQKIERKVPQNMKKCGYCGLVNVEGSSHCSYCSTNLSVICPTCSHQAQSSDRVCGGCGFKIGNMANVPRQLRRAKTALRENQLDEAKKLVDRIFDWWPNHSEAKELLTLIVRKKKSIEKKIAEIDELVEKKYHYTVRKLFIKERYLVQSSLSLQSMEKESLQKIHIAENHLKQAENSQDESIKMDYYLHAIDIAADCERATQILAKSPPLPPSSLQVTTESAAISLKWKPSDAKGHIIYRVLRKKGEAGKHLRDGEIVQETAATSYTDYSAVGGHEYYYSIYALRGSIVSKEYLSDGPFIRNAEVDHLEVIQAEQQIELQWRKPAGAVAVEVWKKGGAVPKGREDGQLLADISEQHAVDRNIVFGKEYGYLVVSIYEVNGKKLYSNGLTRLHKLATTTKMLENIIVERKEDGIMLQWDHWDSTYEGLDFYYAYAPFSVTEKESIPIDKLPDLGQKVEVQENQVEALLQVNMSGTVYILPVTYNDEVAVIGAMMISRNLPEVSSIRHRIAGNRVLVQWSWPNHIQEVAIVCDENTFAKRIPQSADDYVLLNKAKYDELNGYQMNLEARDYYLTIFTQTNNRDEVIYSSGEKYLFVNSEQVTVTYELKLQGLFRKRMTLQIDCDVPIWLPDLILVKKETTVPTNKEQGEIIYKIKSEQIDGTKQFDIPNEFLQNDAYAKLFFENDLDAKKIRLQTTQGKESMKLW